VHYYPWCGCSKKCGTIPSLEISRADLDSPPESSVCLFMAPLLSRHSIIVNMLTQNYPQVKKKNRKKKTMKTKIDEKPDDEDDDVEVMEAEDRVFVLAGGAARFMPQWDKQILGPANTYKIEKSYTNPPRPLPLSRCVFFRVTICFFYNVAVATRQSLLFISPLLLKQF
jgi:hypothetical protein